MKRRAFLKTSVLAGAATALNTSLLSAQGAEKAFTMAEIRKGVGFFAMQGGTIGWFMDGDNLVVVDSQFPEQATTLLAQLRKQTDRKIDILFNTHHHGDHTRGNPVLIPESLQSIAHENSRLWQQKSAEASGNANEQAYPQTTFREAMHLDLVNEGIAVQYHGRAHTSGDSVIHFENANVAHVGDLVFNRHPPYIDRRAGASIAGWMGVLEKLHSGFDADTELIFGHGQDPWGITGGREDLLIMRDFLGGLLAYADKALKAGKPIEEISAVGMVPGFPDHAIDTQRGKSMLAGAIRTACEEVQAGG